VILFAAFQMTFAIITPVPTSLNATKSKLPHRWCPPPKAIEYPSSTQSTAMRPMAKTFCMSIESMFLALTMPP
jgi:hypothetical protein